MKVEIKALEDLKAGSEATFDTMTDRLGLERSSVI